MKIKNLLIFTITLISGLWFAGFFEQYRVKIGIIKTFSRSEVKKLIGKNVREKCFEQNGQKLKTGKVIGYSGSFFGQIRPHIKWTDEKVKYTAYPKSYFEECIEVIK